LADGTAIAIISPFTCINGAWLANANYLPFIQVASVSSINPYNAAGFQTVAGPFSSQFGNIINYGVDYCRINFINTEASIQCKGKLISSFFY